MAINADGGGINRNNIRPADFQRARETRQANLDAKVADATQAPGQLTTAQINQRQSAYNSALGDIDRLKGADGQGVLGSIAPDWVKAFPVPADWKIQGATKPGFGDNAGAREIKQGYANANNEANRERTSAAQTARKLGPGDHTMDNGDKVKVATDPETGKTTVTTTRPDGSSKTVSYGSNPDQVSVSRKDQYGREETIEKDGTRITQTEDKGIFGAFGGALGGKETTTYDLDHNGNPVRTKQSGQNNWEQTTVNNDGSTDTKKEIYKDDKGEPVYQTTHEDSAVRGFPHPGWPPERPEPGRPFPGPRFPWDLDPFRPQFPPLDLENIRPN